MGTLLVVLGVHGYATVQDAGRPGFMHDGVPPGGALVPELAVRANHGAGNAPSAALIEVFGSLTLAVRGSPARVCAEDGAPTELAPDEPFTLARRPTLRVRYLAVAGGIDVPRALGGRGTLAIAGLGGHEGRGLARGDVLRVEGEESDGRALAARVVRDGQVAPSSLDLTARVRVIAGPDAARFGASALEALVHAPFTVLPSSDRTGSRLGGPSLHRLGDDRAGPTPMVRGAIQVPASGEPIVLGPDHPTTGGYPVIGVVITADLGRFFARPIGATVQFTLASVPDARAAALA